MAIGRLYYFTLSILALGFCCYSHYEPYPGKGWKLHSGVGNKYRKDPEEAKREKKAKKEQKKDRKHKKRDKKDNDRRKDDEPEEWIADFSSKRKGGPRPIIPLSDKTPAPEAGPEGGVRVATPHPSAGRVKRAQYTPTGTSHPTTRHARRVSFDGDQARPSGNFPTSSTAYDYIYGQGSVRTDEPARSPSLKSPQSGRGHQHSGSHESPQSSHKHSDRSHPTISNKSRRATVAEATSPDTFSMPRSHADGYFSPTGQSRTFWAD